MYKVIWSNIHSSGEPKFETLEEAQSWINGHISNNTFGLPERWLSEPLEGVETRETELEPAQPEIAEHTIMQMQYDEEDNELGEVEVTIPFQAARDAIIITEYLHPAQYTYEIIDITEEYEIQQRRANRAARGRIFDSCCKEVINYIQGYNDDMELTLEQIQSMVSTFSTIDVLLSKGYAKTARSAIQAIEPDEVVTAEMKSDILAIFEKYPID